MEKWSYSNSQFDAALKDLMIISASEDPRLDEVATAMLFKQSSPEGRIWEAETTADIAEYYGLNPEEMQQAFRIYDANLKGNANE